MSGLANHFAPRLAKGVDPSRHYPVLSATAVAGIPEFVRKTFGQRVLDRANRASMLDLELIAGDECFIPHAVMCRFAESIERQTGHADYGLLIAPHLSIKNYGCWGAYILGAETLGEAALRVARTVRFHSIGDCFDFTLDGDLARIGYLSAAKGKSGYAHVACGALGVVISFCQAYLTTRWAPVRAELDIPRPVHTWPYEETYGCPVVFDANSPAVWLETRHLAARRSGVTEKDCVTLGDLARSRSILSAADLPAIVAEQVRLQLRACDVSIEQTALALDMSIRSLQRDLNRDGTSFRDIASAVRLERARGLLSDTTLPITQIAIDLGYSAPAHFARAFRKATGLSPVEFRTATKS